MKSGVVGAVCVLALAASGCGGSSNSTSSTSTRAGAGPPVQLPARNEPGRQVIAQSGCLACHQLGSSGNHTLAADLTRIGARMSRSDILRSLRGGPGIMPSYVSLGDKRLNEVADYLSRLK